MKAILAYKTGEKIKEVSVFPRRLDLPDYDKINQLVDSDKEWYLEVIEARPVYDADTQKLEFAEEATTNPHPDYPKVKIWLKYWNVVDKTADELKQIVLSKKEENDRLLEKSELMERLIIFAVGVLAHIEQGGTKTAKMSTILDLVKGKAIKIWQNDDLAQQKIQDITDGNTVDLDSGWVNN